MLKRRDENSENTIQVREGDFLELLGMETLSASLNKIHAVGIRISLKKNTMYQVISVSGLKPQEKAAGMTRAYVRARFPPPLPEIFTCQLKKRSRRNGYETFAHLLMRLVNAVRRARMKLSRIEQTNPRTRRDLFSICTVPDMRLPNEQGRRNINVY